MQAHRLDDAPARLWDRKMEEISILRMFADYLPTEETRNALAGAIIDNADLDPEKGSAVVYAHGARYIPMRLLERERIAG